LLAGLLLKAGDSICHRVSTRRLSVIPRRGGGRGRDPSHLVQAVGHRADEGFRVNVDEKGESSRSLAHEEVYRDMVEPLDLKVARHKKTQVHGRIVITDSHHAKLSALLNCKIFILCT
jgi:hypothetical protein